MAGPAVTPAGVDYADVQGLVRFGYRVLKESSYVLVRVRDAEAARAWLRSAPVSNATTQDPPPETALQVAFTAAGLEAIGVSAAVLAGFSREFLVGMTEDNRSRRLGDVGNNAPAVWDWGAGSQVPHLLVMFFAKPGALAPFMQRVTGPAWEAAFDVVRALPTSNLGGVEPFGFADGISQPKLDWAQERNVSANPIDYSNIVALGEFLLGYRNEYDKYTDRPLLDGNADTESLPAAEEAPGKKDLARNGTYLVMRQLRQDVRGFWQFVHKQAGGDAAAVETLASAMVGRTRAGAPLVPIQQQPIPGIGPDPDEVRLNQFTFDDDPAGAACPIASHVRRSNPRTTDFPGRPTGFRRLLSRLGLARREFRDDLISPVRFHRLLRRGREYGPGLSPSDALQPAPEHDPERGLHFISLAANISRQFEFLQNAWMMSTKFSGLSGESDPLLGHRQPLPGCPIADSFNIPAEGGVRRRVTGVPQFVTVRGGAYFFLPGLRALQYLARSGR
jgi:Dyp-type peroxidase family